MKASSESGLCAMEISRVGFKTADSECLVLTETKILSTKTALRFGDQALLAVATNPFEPLGNGRGGHHLQRVARKEGKHRQCESSPYRTMRPRGKLCKSAEEN